jgi:hypothetical protein
MRPTIAVSVPRSSVKETSSIPAPDPGRGQRFAQDQRRPFDQPLARATQQRQQPLHCHTRQSNLNQLPSPKEE